MWKIFQRSSSADSARRDGSTVFSLEFVDKPMYLVSQSEESSIGSDSKLTNTDRASGRDSQDSEQE